MRWLDNLRLSSELAGAPERCVHVGDRESDIYELYCLAEELGTGFLVRSCVDRLAEDGGTTIAKVMAEVQSSGTHEVRFRDAQGNDHCAVLSVRHATMTVRPPIGKQGKYRHQELQIIHAEELDPPEGRAPVFWKLITNLPVATHAEAVNKLDWYALRWKIETFFRTLKTGCRIEENAPRHGRSPGQLHRAVLHRGLAGVLVDDAQPRSTGRGPCCGLHRRRALPARARVAEQKTPGTAGSRFLCQGGRKARRLSRPRFRPATGDDRHVAGLLPPRRPRRRSSHRSATGHLWVTARAIGRLRSIPMTWAR